VIAATNRLPCEYEQMRKFILRMTAGKWTAGPRASGNQGRMLYECEDPSQWATAKFPSDTTIRHLCVEKGISYAKLTGIGMKMNRESLPLEIKHYGDNRALYKEEDTYIVDEINLNHASHTQHGRVPTGMQGRVTTTSSNKGPSMSGVVTIGCSRNSDGELVGEVIEFTAVAHHPAPPKNARFSCPNMPTNDREARTFT
jgi:hypothetical protein